MNVGSEAMYRKARAGYIEPMPKKQLHKIERALRLRAVLSSMVKKQTLT
ncbi:hypothetical protein ABHC71_03325 [Ruminococcus bicirculans (ex Wegman et al. 2014)]|nr:hypothetical protein [Ruminococcus bicirculans (ex Wegman et al. 2014)]